MIIFPPLYFLRMARDSEFLPQQFIGIKWGIRLKSGWVSSMSGKNNVSGSWLGNYYYESTAQPFGFEAVFIELSGNVEGSILDDGQLGEAKVFGTFVDPEISFTKKYLSGHNPVVYKGTLSDEGKKLSGTWSIANLSKGRWIAWRQEEEEIPDLETEDEEKDERTRELEREKVLVRPAKSR